ncbi:MAG: VWA domain-containing protein [Alphaproteobacteria bacterium]|nr:VWA domain-containing protein [Alphaproteobacteria bacterium]
MADVPKPIAKPGPSGDVAAFLEQLAKAPAVRKAGPKGRLIFALDATMSRQPTWDSAGVLQSEMFEAAAGAGGLAIQLVSFRGIGEFDVRPWTEASADLKRAMSGYACRGGFTQIGRLLRHVEAEARRGGVQALVFIGDAFEEDADKVVVAAGKLGLAGTPAFVFQEGRDKRVAAVFQEIARVTRGAYGRFDAGSAAALRDLLRAVAVYASGGRKALELEARARGGAALLLTRQLGA